MKKKTLSIAAVALLVLGAVAYFLGGTPLLTFLTYAVAVAGLALLAHSYRVVTEKLTKVEDWIHQEGVLTTRQVQSLFEVYLTIQPRRPLPPMRHMAVSPDFASTLVSLVLSSKPRTILELGSGTSTILSSYCLEKNGVGNVISLDHEARFADETRAAIAQHGLSGRATVYHAPLKPVTLDGREYQWYDLSVLPETPPIDLLIVDGPPAFLGEKARYPALPLLFSRLSSNGAVLLIDDAARPDEQAIVREWAKQYPEFQKLELFHEKGTVIMARPGASRAASNGI